MNERERRIVLLLGSLHDHLPSPRGSLKTTSGLAAIERVQCPACGPDDRGWVTDRFKRRTPCQACGGSPVASSAGGFKRRDGGRGWVSVDPMDADRRPVQTATESAPPTRAARMVSCDGCGGAGHGRWHIDVDDGREWREPCRYCNGSGKVTRPHLTEPRTTEDAGLTATERRDESGSYADLERCMADLPQWSRWALLAVHAYRQEGHELEATAADALAELEQWMPDPIRVPAHVRHADKRDREHRARLKGLGSTREAVVARDREIRRLIRRGRPTQWVAAEFGLSASQVNRIFAGSPEAAA